MEPFNIRVRMPTSTQGLLVRVEISSILFVFLSLTVATNTAILFLRRGGNHQLVLESSARMLDVKIKHVTKPLSSRVEVFHLELAHQRLSLLVLDQWFRKPLGARSSTLIAQPSFTLGKRITELAPHSYLRILLKYVVEFFLCDLPIPLVQPRRGNSLYEIRVQKFAQLVVHTTASARLFGCVRVLKLLKRRIKRFYRPFADRYHHSFSLISTKFCIVADNVTS